MNFKRLLAVGTAAVMAFSFAGCGKSKDELVKEAEKAVAEIEKALEIEEVTLEGTWKARHDSTQLYPEAFGVGFDEETEVYFEDYCPEIYEVFTLTLNEDGTYDLTYYSDVDYNLFHEAFIEYLIDYDTEQNGGVPYTEEELVEIYGTADLKEATAELFTDEEMDYVFGEIAEEGTYTNTDGAIELDNGMIGSFIDGVLELDVANVLGLYDGDVIYVEFTKA